MIGLRDRILKDSGQGRALTLTGDVVNDAYRALGVQGDGAAVGSQAGSGVWPAATNLCTNGGFETNTLGWSAIPTDDVGGWINSGGVISRITTDSKFGSGCAQFAGDGVSAQEGMVTAGGLGVFTNLTTYTFSAWFKGDCQNVSIEVGLGGNAAATAIGVVLADWTRYSVSLVGNGQKSWGAIRVNTATARTFKVDGAQCETGAVATPYIETDGGTATSTAGRIQMPSTGMSATAGAWLEKWYPSHANTAVASGYATLRRWADDADNLLELRYDYTNDRYSFRRRAAAAETEVTVAATFALDVKQTLLATWSATTIALSVNGATATSGANTNIPTLAATTVDVGSLSGTSQQPQGRHAFSGSYGPGGSLLGNGDSARVALLGNSIDPLNDLPRPDDLVAFWDGVNDRYVSYV